MSEPMAEEAQTQGKTGRKVDVLAEILAWSKDRPDWQRDALRCLVLTGELEDEDIDSLAGICKSAHGLADEQGVIPCGQKTHARI